MAVKVLNGKYSCIEGCKYCWKLHCTYGIYSRKVHFAIPTILQLHGHGPVRWPQHIHVHVHEHVCVHLQCALLASMFMHYYNVYMITKVCVTPEKMKALKWITLGATYVHCHVFVCSQPTSAPTDFFFPL